MFANLYAKQRVKTLKMSKQRRKKRETNENYKSIRVELN